MKFMGYITNKLYDCCSILIPETSYGASLHVADSKSESFYIVKLESINEYEGYPIPDISDFTDLIKTCNKLCSDKVLFSEDCLEIAEIEKIGPELYYVMCS